MNGLWILKFNRYVFFRKYPLDVRVSRLFGIACCREFWDQLTDERSRKAVEVAELFTDGLATTGELKKAQDDALNAYYSVATFASAAANAYLVAAADSITSIAFYHVASTTTEEFQQQGLIIAQMYPTTFNEQWITPTTTALAQQIYNNKDFSLMPILADALQDVDCNEDILNHLRGKGPFYKGNYIIDVLTGKRTTEASSS